MAHPEILWLLAAAVAWWIGALGAAVRGEVRALEEGDPLGGDYALVALLRRLRDDPVALGLRCRLSRMLSAAFLPLGLAGAAGRLPPGWVVIAVFAGWLAGAAAEASDGGRTARRWGRARGGLIYALWAKTLHPIARGLRPLLRLRLSPRDDEGSPIHVRVESQASRVAGGAELGRQEMRFLRRLLASTGILAADMATPWNAVCWISADLDPGQAAAAIRNSGHSRLPVVDDAGVVGLLTVKDLLGLDGTGHPPGPGRRLPVRPVYFVRQEITARDLLEELQEARAHLAVVVDRLGRQVGIVTMEDVLEEIVGELHDEREAPVR